MAAVKDPESRLDRLRRRAKKLRKETGVAHHEALDVVAREHGFKDWRHLYDTQKAGGLVFRGAR